MGIFIRIYTRANALARCYGCNVPAWAAERDDANGECHLCGVRP